MTSEFARDAAMTAAIFGFFAMGWFGWAQEHPPKPWKKWLISGSVLAALILVVAGLLSWSIWNTGTVFDRDTSASCSASSWASSSAWPASERAC